MVNPRIIGSAGIALIQGFEKCKLRAYPDPGTGGRPWTIGWGHTGAEIYKGLVWTQNKADAVFEIDILTYAKSVSIMIGDAKTSQNQFDALVSFQFNTGHLHGSTLLAKHCAGDFAGAIAEFAKWNHAGGVVMNGLTTRRAAEAALYGKG